MSKLPQPSKSQDIAYLRRHWLADHSGIFAEIARQVGVSSVFVSDVFYGRRHSRTGEIERRFASLGAPGFNRSAAA